MFSMHIFGMWSSHTKVNAIIHGLSFLLGSYLDIEPKSKK